MGEGCPAAATLMNGTPHAGLVSAIQGGHPSVFCRRKHTVLECLCITKLTAGCQRDVVLISVPSQPVVVVDPSSLCRLTLDQHALLMGRVSQFMQVKTSFA